MLEKLCNRKLYNRRSLFWWTFSIPKISAILVRKDFFNSHRRLHSKPVGAEMFRPRLSHIIVRQSLFNVGIWVCCKRYQPDDTSVMRPNELRRFNFLFKCDDTRLDQHSPAVLILRSNGALADKTLESLLVRLVTHAAQGIISSVTVEIRQLHAILRN